MITKAPAALSLVEQQLLQDPFNKTLILAVGENYFTNKRYLEAAKVYGKLRYSSKPELISTVLKFTREIKQTNSKELRLSLVELHLQEEFYQDALFELEQLLEEYPQDQQLITQITNLANKLENKGSSIPLLEKCLFLNQSNIHLYELLAGSYLAVEKMDKAIRLYQRALSVEPGNPTLLSALGDLYETPGECCKRTGA